MARRKRTVERQTGGRSLVGAFLSDATPAAPERPFAVWASLALIALICFCQVRSFDIWWHLKTGEWVVRHWSIPHTDPFSFTAEGSPWVSHEWLFGMLAFGAWRAGGVAGLVAMKVLLIVLLFGMVAWLGRIRGARPGFTALVMAALYAIGRFRFTERPELVSVPLAAGFLVIREKSPDRPWLLLVLPFLQLLWVNLHGGTALLGWGLAGALLAERLWTSRRERRPGRALLEDKPLRWTAAAFAGVVLLTAANPHGLGVLTYGRIRADSPLDNREFQSLVRIASDGIDLSIVLVAAFAGLLLLCLILCPRRIRLYEWLLFPALLALTLLYFRFRVFFGFLLAPGLAACLSHTGMLRRVRSWVPTLAALALFGYSAVLERGSYFYRFGNGVHAGVFPAKGAAFIRSSGLSGRMFNTYAFGGYLIWSLWPEQKVFIDGREDVYIAPGVLDEYVRCFQSRDRWEALVRKYGLDYAILQYPEKASPRRELNLDALAFPRTDWALVHFDDVGAIYVRRKPRYEALIRANEYRWIQPFQTSGYLDDIVRDPAALGLFLGEMERNLRENPDSFRNHFLLGIVALKRGREYWDQAYSAFGRAAEINPDFAPAWINLGNTCAGLGRTGEAIHAFKKALSIQRNPDLERQLRRLQR